MPRARRGGGGGMEDEEDDDQEALEVDMAVELVEWLLLLDIIVC